MDAVDALVQAIRRSRLLGPAQLNELKTDLLPHTPDAESLAQALLKHGLLTPYQLDQIGSGAEQDLVVGPYRLLQLLGEGGLCQVFKAQHSATREVVALKALHPELRTSNEALDGLRQEMAGLARLSHPAIPRAIDVCLDGPRFWFTMELLHGLDLARLLGLVGQLPIAQACDYIRQAAVGLQYAFEQGLVHRDVKPHNLFVSYQGDHIHLLDIGLLRREWSFADDLSTRTPANPAGEVMGTPDYIAPEQAVRAHLADTRADIYSLGCTLYHLLTGQVPFPGGSVRRKLLQHQQTPAPSVCKLVPAVPPELDAVVQRMLAKKPEDRFQTPLGVSVALHPFCQADAPRLSLERFRPAEETAALSPAPARRPPASGATGTMPKYGQPGFPERRSAPRRSGNTLSVLVSDAQGTAPPLRAWVLNRSSGGLGLLVEEALEIGTVVTVRPDSPLAVRWVPVSVIHCSPERIRWRVGLQFLEKLSWNELRGFG